MALDVIQPVRVKPVTYRNGEADIQAFLRLHIQRFCRRLARSFSFGYSRREQPVTQIENLHALNQRNNKVSSRIESAWQRSPNLADPDAATPSRHDDNAI